METEAHPNHTIKELPCSNCGKPVETTRKERKDHDNHYCDTECQYEGQTGEGHHNYNTVSVECVECGSILKREEGSIGSMGAFCDHTCYGDYLSKEWSGQSCPNWRGGLSHTDALRKTIDDESWRAKADRARKSAGRECELCGDSPDGKKLDVHHIVPMVSGGTNGQWNLMVLCDGCHSTVEAYTRTVPGMEAVLVE
jgi:5-methylcytosine-specific restriction endonuclease McrA